MSDFQGYMGGDRGQGYINSYTLEGTYGNNNESIHYQSQVPNPTRGVGAELSQSAQIPSFVTPSQPAYANNSTIYSPSTGTHMQPSTMRTIPATHGPNSVGSITKFYQQETPPAPSQPLTASQSGQVQQPSASNVSFTQQAAPLPQQFYQQPYQQQHFTGSFHQPASHQTIPTPTDVNPRHSQMQHHLQNPIQQTQPAILQAQSIAQQQRVPNYLLSSSIPNAQPHQQPTTPSAVMETGNTSYTARSAHAYATLGTPSPPPAHSISQPQTPAASSVPPSQPTTVATKFDETPAIQALQNRILTDCTRRVQEHAYYMKQAMDKDDLATVLDRAMHMVGELGHASSGQLTPKNYYELHMRALDDMPNLEEYLLSITTAEGSKYKMKNIYDFAQYCPRVLPRLYIQIAAASALIRSKEESAPVVLNDLIEAVRCVQNPLRGLFLRHFLLQVTRDKLPDGPQLKDSLDFVLANFIEMNRLWVRIQHLPGEGKSKEQRKRRERERNELRILVGTNLVRLSQLEGLTSKLYGEVILPKILEQIVACGDPLAQAYLIDCIIQVFPDEHHIETLPILLAVCPKLRDKVNIRTIMQSLMDRLANYYADEELLDEADTNEVKKSVARDSFLMFEECVLKVFQARGPRLVAREVIRLQTALLTFSLKCFPGNMEQVSRCLGVCIDFVRQAVHGTAISTQTPLLEDSAIKLDEVSIVELQKMLSIPLDSLAMKVLELKHYSDLIHFLAWENRRDIGMIMLRAIDTSGFAPSNVNEVEELFSILLPVISGPTSTAVIAGEGDSKVGRSEVQEEDILVSKLVHLLHHDNFDVAYEMVHIARSHICESGIGRVAFNLPPVVFSALRLSSRIAASGRKTSVAENNKGNTLDEVKNIANPSDEGSVGPTNAIIEPANGAEEQSQAPLFGDEVAESAEQVVEVSPFVSCRKVLLFVQNTIAMIAKPNPELGLKLYLLAAVAADEMFAIYQDERHQDASHQIVSELLTQAYSLHEEEIDDPKAQQRCIVNMVGTLLQCKSLPPKDYEIFITKTAQFAAKIIKKQDQCEMVALCSHLFFSVGKEGMSNYKNPQRTLECLQRSLKLADASVNSDPCNVYLFVDLLEDYLYFFEQGNPVITDAYITGLVALIKEHLESLNGLLGTEAHAVAGVQAHFFSLCEFIQTKKKEHQDVHDVDHDA